MKKHLEQFVDKYVRSVNAGNAAVFAGAGMSVASGLVNWKELLREMAKEIDLDVDKETDLIAVAQFYKNNKGGRGSINDELIEQFTKNVQESENHNILASLPIHTVWTTNYDNLIERTFEKAGKIVDVKRTPQNLAISIRNRDAVVYKMHGDVSLSHEAVLTKDDYENYNEKRQLYTTALQGDLVSKTFMFVGFSFEDPNLEYILARIRILLGENTPEHYCFFKTIDESDYEEQKDYLYDKVKLEHRIQDLKRYGIQALLIDSYDEITEVLRLIYVKLKRRNIFISGAAHEYGDFEKSEAENLISNFSKSLAENDFKVISGFGLGIGSSVINGTLSHIYSGHKKSLDDYLILRPFPQNISDSEERKKLWKQYRRSMLQEAGIAVFFFGNKLVEEKVIDSDGLIQEFELAVEMGIKVIPVGCTGFVSEKLWKKVVDQFENYHPDHLDLRKSIESLGEKPSSEKELINNLNKCINLLQKHI